MLVQRVPIRFRFFWFSIGKESRYSAFFHFCSIFQLSSENSLLLRLFRRGPQSVHPNYVFYMVVPMVKALAVVCTLMQGSRFDFRPGPPCLPSFQGPQIGFRLVLQRINTNLSIVCSPQFIALAQYAFKLQPRFPAEKECMMRNNQG